MAEHPNVALVRRAVEAMTETDMSKAQQEMAVVDAFMADDIIWHEIGRADMGFEFMLNALRLTGGFDPNLFGERTGMNISAITKALNEAEAKGLIYRDHKLIKPTDLGQRFLNDLQEMFLVD